MSKKDLVKFKVFDNNKVKINFDMQKTNLLFNNKKKDDTKPNNTDKDLVNFKVFDNNKVKINFDMQKIYLLFNNKKKDDTKPNNTDIDYSILDYSIDCIEARRLKEILEQKLYYLKNENSETKNEASKK